jgi:large subunit ribosomal protein L7Ae
MANVPKEVSDRALEAAKMAKQGGSVKKGVNEVTKSVERNLATLVLIAEDVEPKEVVMHIPTLCEQKKIPFVYVPTKQEIGNAVGINVPCSAIAIEKAGQGEQIVKEVIAKATGKSATEPASKQAKQPDAAKPKTEKPKKEKTAKPATEKPAEPKPAEPPKEAA